MDPHDQSFLAQPTFDLTTGRQEATRLLVQGPYGILRNRAALRVAADDAGRRRTRQMATLRRGLEDACIVRRAGRLHIEVWSRRLCAYLTSTMSFARPLIVRARCDWSSAGCTFGSCPR